MRSIVGPRWGVVVLGALAAACTADPGSGMLTLTLVQDAQNPAPLAAKIVLAGAGAINRVYSGQFPTANGADLTLQFPNLLASDSPISLEVQAFDVNGCLVGKNLVPLQVIIKAGEEVKATVTISKSATACSDGAIANFTVDAGGGEANREQDSPDGGRGVDAATEVSASPDAVDEAPSLFGPEASPALDSGEDLAPEAPDATILSTPDLAPDITLVVDSAGAGLPDVADAPIADAPVDANVGSKDVALGAPDAPCGAVGQPCCATNTCSAAGTVCGTGGTCVSCGAEGAVCCAGSACSYAGDICSGGLCVPCGWQSQPCCASNSCTAPGTVCGSAKTCQSCGSVGLPCCTGGICSASGTVCGNGGTCVACGGEGSACCAGSTCASAGDLCSGGVCVACGGQSQPCCAGSSCTAVGTICGTSAKCVACGGLSQACCASNSCSAAGTVCGNSGTCQSCGTQGLPCCAGNVCSATGTVCGGGGLCVACGAAGAVCCAGNTCASAGDVCSGGSCVACGGAGQPCCAGSTCTDVGAVCNGSGICGACVPPGIVEHASVEFGPVNAISPKFLTIDATHILVLTTVSQAIAGTTGCARHPIYATILTLNPSAGTVTAGATRPLPGPTASYWNGPFLTASMAPLDATRALLAHGNCTALNESAGYAEVVTFDLAHDALTLGTPLVFETGWTLSVTALKSDASHVVVGYQTGGDAGKTALISVDLGSTTPLVLSASQAFTGFQQNPKFVALANNRLLDIYRGPSSFGTVRVMTVALSPSAAVTVASESTIDMGGAFSGGSAIQIDGANVFATYTSGTAPRAAVVSVNPTTNAVSTKAQLTSIPGVTAISGSFLSGGPVAGTHYLASYKASNVQQIVSLDVNLFTNTTTAGASSNCGGGGCPQIAASVDSNYVLGYRTAASTKLTASLVEAQCP